MSTYRQSLLYEIGLKAYDSTDGLRLVLSSPQHAQQTRFSFYKLRQRMRKKSHPDLNKIEALMFTLEDNCLVIKRGVHRLQDLTIIDIDTGENMTGKFDFIEDLVKIDESEME